MIIENQNMPDENNLKTKGKIKIADLLFNKGILKDRKLIEALIIEGRVYANGIKIKKPGDLVKIDSKITLKSVDEFVSRGALKLKGVVEEFNINLDNRVVIDLGASTGGFTDFLLKNNVLKVIAVDVGYGQFAWSLRKNEKVQLFERTNVKNLEKDKFELLPDLAVADLSFISLRTIFNKIIDLVSENGEILLLIKPQFELKKELVENKGVIKSKELHIKVLSDLINFLKKYENIKIIGLTFSKIKGAKGNIEYWIYLKKIINDNANKKDFNYDKILVDINSVVEDAHAFFLKK